MISAPNAYFTTEEAKKIGAVPRFFFTIYPFYFLTGIASESGTYTDTTFVEPERIEVDYQVTSASYTSPVETANLDDWPSSVTVSWTIVAAGYTATVEYRTAATEVLLAVASYSTMVSGNSYDFYEFYQWKVTWTAIRGWAFDTEDTEDLMQAYALDAYDPEDEYQSYASVSELMETTSYMDTVRFLGEYPISSAEIVDGGSISLECPIDFTELVSGDHTLTLVNTSGKYSPGNDSFIFAGEAYWYLKGLRAELGYLRAGTSTWDKITIYEGMIINWGPVIHEVDGDGKFQDHTVEIYSRDRISWLLDKQIGVPDSDGTPNPVIYGDVFRQADQITDMMGDPPESANFEDGNLYELDNTFTANGGTIAVDSNNPYSGEYCCRTVISSASAYAYGVLNLGITVNKIFFSCYMCVNSYPAAPTGSEYILSVIGGSDYIKFYVASDGHIIINYNGTSYDSTWYIDDYSSSYRQLTVGIYSNANPGIIKVSIDGSEVWSKDDLNLTSKVWQYIYFGAFNSSSAKDYSIDWDDLKLFSDYVPYQYQINGYPYQSIDQVYIDGSVRVEQTKNGIISRIISGRTPNSTSIVTSADYGMVAFTDFNNIPSGTISIRAKHDEIINPVDIIEGIITLAGLEDYIDSVNFAAIKALIADDIINVYFEDTTAGDAIKSILSLCLLNCYIDYGKIKLSVYQGEAPITYDLELTEDDIFSIYEEINQEDIQNKITAKWGWKNPKLYYEANDTTGQAYLGIKSTDLDFTWGQEVASESQAMVKNKVDWLLTRLMAAKNSLKITGFLNLARLEIGDTVLVSVPFLRDSIIYTVFSKQVNMQTPYNVELEVIRFLGES